MPAEVATRSVLARVAVWAAVVLAAVAGAWPLFVVGTVVLLLAYVELRAAIGPVEPGASVAAGGIAVAACTWLGISGRPSGLPWVIGALLVALLVVRVVGNELGALAPAGAVADIAATTTAAGVVGLLGAHLMLVRAVPGFGFHGVVAFATIASVHAAATVVSERLLRSTPVAAEVSPLSWASLASGIVVSVVAGSVAGALLDPPLDAGSGAVFGATLGVLLPAGRLAASALVPPGGRRPGAPFAATPDAPDDVAPSRRTPLFGSPFRASGGVLFSALAFYWAFSAVAR